MFRLKDIVIDAGKDYQREVVFLRDPKRLPPLYMHLLCMHSIYYPDMRVCQFLDNFFSFLKNKDIDPFFIEDDEEKFKDYVNEFVGRSR